MCGCNEYMNSAVVVDEMCHVLFTCPSCPFKPFFFFF